MFLCQGIRQIGHTSAAEYNCFGTVFGHRASDFGADAIAGVRSCMFQFQNCHFRGSHARTTSNQAIAVQVVF